VASKGEPAAVTAAVAYHRTSSAANLGEGKDSLRRQQEAIHAHAVAHRLELVGEFHDAAVSGADHLGDRPGFAAMLAAAAAMGATVILVESASRFARDLIVQETGHALLKAQGLALVAVDDPDAFTADTPTARLVRQVLGAVSEFEKASLVAKLKGARDRKSAALGRRCEGRKPVPALVVAAARRLAPGRSLRQVAAELAALGHLGPGGKPYGAGSIAAMLRSVAAVTLLLALGGCSLILGYGNLGLSPMGGGGLWIRLP
jgi:DNA invertase Pin-like site-specific DNA recombinase